MSIKENCFGFNCSKNECRVLTELVCSKKECAFYKTHEQYVAGLKILEELEGNVNG